ncbi:MAG: UDP-N-acetylglucosamine 2-epimerase [Desulfobacterales bacterium]|nr:UDP-N-acetylglucosamine 2-epimerase [Desulfobacterales bacterium]
MHPIKRICIVTGTRAEYGLLYWLIKYIEEDSFLDLQLIVTGTHLSEQYGHTVDKIIEDGFGISDKIEIPLRNNCGTDISKAVSNVIDRISNSYNQLNPDIVILLGDRYEIFGAAVSAFINKIPIAHIHGGEVTEGSLDDGFRHSISKMASIHFTSTETYRHRLINMGENPDRVFNFGAIGLDNIRKLNLKSCAELESDLGFSFSEKTALITYHPVTLIKLSFEKQIDNLLTAISQFNFNSIFTMPNADEGSDLIQNKISQFTSVNKDTSLLIKSMGQLNYLSALKYINIMIGNSSSGIIESPFFNLPVVNIGNRQKGRICCENIFNCNQDVNSIISAIRSALSYKNSNMKNPYGDEEVSSKIFNLLKTLNINNSFLKKGFYDVSTFHSLS